MTLFRFPDNQVAMEAKDTMFDVHAHEYSGESEIELGNEAASGDDHMVSPMAAIDKLYHDVNKHQPSGSVPGRFVCGPFKSPTSIIRELEARTSVRVIRCIPDGMEDRQTYAFPPFCLIGRCLAK